MNAVIYARYSSHSQSEQSIEGQLRDCCEYAQREGYVVVRDYIDRALTGRSDDRPSFQQMVKDAQKKQFQFVIVWKLDRFARNRFDSAMYKNELKKHGVRVISATEAISDSPEGIMLEGMLESLAEYYSANLAKHIRRGIRDSIINGTHLGAPAPIGFKSENKRLVADEKTAPSIQWAFQQYANGVSKKDIIAALNKKGIRNRAGNPLTQTSFQKVLRNEKYIGVYRYSGQIVEGACDALIDEATFRRVQVKLDAKKHAPAANRREEFLLQGKAYCGYCGTRLMGCSGTSKTGVIHYYYACGKSRRTRNCNKKMEKKAFIEWYVVEQTVEYVLTPERMDYIATCLVEESEKSFGNNRLNDLERNIKRIDIELNRAIDASLEVSSKAARARYYEKIEILEAQKADLELDLARLRIAQNAIYTQDQIKAWLKEFCKGDPLDLNFQRRIVDVFINSIYLYDNKLVMYYNIKDGEQVSYIEMLDSTEFSENIDIAEVEGVRLSDAMLHHY